MPLHPFGVGSFRPIFLWGGPGTYRVTQLSFPRVPVDEKTFLFSHSIEGAERVAAMGFNWVFLAFHWGFPPELEDSHRESFRAAVHHFHQVGVKVIGTIQTSNCIAQGSYAEKDWYAQDTYGHKIYCFTGRSYTSLFHPDWLAEIRERIRELIATGADGIFFDNPWIGGVGHDVAEMPLGPIGSHDPYTQASYERSFEGERVPVALSTRKARDQQYLEWRARSAAQQLGKWVEVARNLKPDTVVIANNFAPVARNSFATMGMDLKALAANQDVVFVDDLAWPRLQEDSSVVANAITLAASMSQVDPKPVVSKTAIKGYGFERMWTPDDIRRAIAESVAVNAPLVVQGSGIRHLDEITQLLHSRYRPQHDALEGMNHWLSEHADWLQARQPASPLAIYYPFDAAHWNWNQVTPIYFAACETLLLKGYPLRVIGANDSWEHVKIVLLPPGELGDAQDRLASFVAGGGRVIALGQKRPGLADRTVWDGWRPLRARIPHWRWLRRRLNQGATISWRFYHRYHVVRWLAKRLKVQEAMVHSPAYIVPPQPFQQVLIEAIGRDFSPRVESEFPVLLTMWQEPNGQSQWHLVNYAEAPQKVTLQVGDLRAFEVFTMGSNALPSRVVGSAVMLTLGLGKIVRAVESG
ncbi:MAG: hypothetical protein GYB66_00985 [Chloroflexi bacterium]|nr:hypothetical protein [Chloroflexota bacterium]